VSVTFTPAKNSFLSLMQCKTGPNHYTDVGGGYKKIFWIKNSFFLQKMAHTGVDFNLDYK
jgi:hypothetical protein